MVRGEEADLYVLPELCLSGYVFESRDEALGLAQSASDALFDEPARFAASRGAAVVMGFAEKDGEELYNSSILLGPGGKRSVYRKVQLFWGEKAIFEPGDKAPEVFEEAGARLGLMICFDWIFPEVARTLALAGAQVLCHSANLVLPYCQEAMVTRCLENRVFAATANRVGGERRAGMDLSFTGMSEVVAPDGAILARASGEHEEVLVVDIDPSRADDKAITPTNDLFGDRRPEVYGL